MQKNFEDKQGYGKNIPVKIYFNPNNFMIFSPSILSDIFLDGLKYFIACLFKNESP